jgi:hypothetical protein
MRSDPTVIVDPIADAEHKLAAVRNAHDRFTDAVAHGSFVGVAIVAPELHAAVRDLLATAHRIEAEIIDDVESVDELVVRAATIAISRELEHLRLALGDGAPPDRARHLFGGRLQTMADVVGITRRKLADQNSAWICYRRPRAEPVPNLVEDGDFTAAGEEGERRVLYRVAIRKARQALRALGDDRDLAHFVRTGAACSDWPEVLLPCVTIGAVIGVAGHVEGIRAAAIAPFLFLDEEHALAQSGGAP